MDIHFLKVFFTAKQDEKVLRNYFFFLSFFSVKVGINVCFPFDRSEVPGFEQVKDS